MNKKVLNKETQVSRRDFISKTSITALGFGIGTLISKNSFAAEKTARDKKLALDKVAIVTGSSRGIGAATAKKLAGLGYKVVVNCVKNDNLAEKVVNEIKNLGGQAVWLKADVRKPDQVKALFDLAEKIYGGVDVVINNAGIMKLSPFATMKDEDFDDMMDTNLKGGFYVLREAAKRVRDKGHIISTSSSITLLKTQTYGPYAASKAAMEIYSSVLAKELKGRHISVNAIAPGLVNTTLFTDGKTPEQIKGFVDRTPFGRLGEPEDIAGVTALLCSGEGWWINGETVFANGGVV